MEALIVIGRLLIGSLFFSSGVGHLTQLAGTTAYAESKGVPAPRRAVIVSGVAFAAGGLSIILGIWGDLGALLLIVCLVPTTVLMHDFWAIDDPNAKQNEMANFMKNVSVIGALFFLLAWFSDSNVPNTITDGVFRIQ